MAERTPGFLPRLAAAGRKVLRLRYTPLRMTVRWKFDTPLQTNETPQAFTS